MTGSMDLFSFKSTLEERDTKTDVDASNSSAQSFSMDSFGGKSTSSFVEFKADEMDGKNSETNASISRSDLEEAEIFFKDDIDKISFREDSASVHGNVSSPQNASKMTMDEDTFMFSETETDSGYVADSVRTVETDFDSTKSSEQNAKQSGYSQIVICSPKTGSAFVDSFKFWALRKKFEHGTLVQALDEQKKPLFLLLQIEEELMAYKYLGSSLDIEVPATVGKREVKYLHPHLLNGGVNPFKGVKAQNFKSNFKVENLANLSKDALQRSKDGVRTLILPNGIKMLPPNLFYNCLVLKEIVIPESVTAISHDAFAGSCFKDIWFNGDCPLGFLENDRLPRGVRVHYRQEFADSFRRNS